MISRILIAASVFLVALGAAGCNTSENPVTPQKMQEMRAKEAEERANFNPSTTAPKGP